MLILTLIQTQAAERVVAPLVEAVRDRRDLDTAFFAIDPTILVRAAVTPERLQKWYGVRSATHEASDRSERVASFLLAFGRSRLVPVDVERTRKIPFGGGIDARFGFKATDGNGRCLLWMCANGQADLALADSQAYRLSGPLSEWFRSEGLWLLRLRDGGKNREPRPSPVPRVDRSLEQPTGAAGA